MDLSELKNLNLQDIKAKITVFADKKTLIKFGISLLIFICLDKLLIIILLTFLYFLFKTKIFLDNLFF